MDYIALFNLLYSTEISEATKDEIVNKINTNISESYEVKPIVETYLELLDTLVFSTASEALIYNIMDETFSQLSEETINEVSDEWVKRKVGDSLKARQSAVDSANKSVKSGVVGLSQLRRQDQAQQNLDRGKEKAASIMNKVERRKEAAKAENANPYTPKAEAPKKEGALGKLKSAVGKVKSWASNVDKTPDYVGLSRAIGAKANKDNIGAETLTQQTTHRTEAPAEEKQPEVKAEAIKTTPKVEKVKQPKAKKEKQSEPAQQKLNLKTPKAEEKQPEVKAEVKADDATKAAKKTSTKATKISKAKKIVADAVTDKATNKGEAPAEEKQPEVKAEVKADDATKASKKRMGSIKINAGSKIKKAEEAPKAGEKQSEIKVEKATPRAENKPAEEPKIKVSTEKSDEDKKYEAKLRREAAARRKDQEKQLEVLRQRKQEMTSKPGYDTKAVEDLDSRISDLEKRLNVTANEALSDLAILLLNTNITESCFVEVMEMAGANKANALKVRDRYDNDMEASLDAIDKDVREGKPVDPEKVKKAEELRQRKEHFEQMFKDKFNDNK